MSVDDFKNIPDVSEGLEFRLFDSTSTFDGTATTLPEGYADVLNPVNLDSIAEVVDIIRADITYSNTNIEAVLNTYNKVKTLKTSSTITLDLTVKTGDAPSVVKLVLDCADEYQIKY